MWSRGISTNVVVRNVHLEWVQSSVLCDLKIRLSMSARTKKRRTWMFHVDSRFSFAAFLVSDERLSRPEIAALKIQQREFADSRTRAKTPTTFTPRLPLLSVHLVGRTPRVPHSERPGASHWIPFLVPHMKGFQLLLKVDRDFNISWHIFVFIVSPMIVTKREWRGWSKKESSVKLKLAEKSFLFSARIWWFSMKIKSSTIVKWFSNVY